MRLWPLSTAKVNTDHLQNEIIFRLGQDRPLVKKIHVNLCITFCVKLDTDRQIDRETDNPTWSHNVRLGGGNWILEFELSSCNQGFVWAQRLSNTLPDRLEDGKSNGFLIPAIFRQFKRDKFQIFDISITWIAERIQRPRRKSWRSGSPRDHTTSTWPVDCSR